MIRNAVLTRAAVLLVLVCPVRAMAAPPLALFGTPVKGADRAVLRRALTAADLRPVRIDDSYFCDKYQTNGVPQEARKLTVCYTARRSTFAVAEYTFPAFMDTGLVRRVIDMVRHQYGSPSSMSGDYDLGPVTAQWNLPGGMRIRVSRGWPITTTFLDLSDAAANRRLNAEVKAVEHARQEKRESESSKAF